VRGTEGPQHFEFCRQCGARRSAETRLGLFTDQTKAAALTLSSIDLAIEVGEIFKGVLGDAPSAPSGR
jgi:hypothetical protein